MLNQSFEEGKFVLFVNLCFVSDFYLGLWTRY